MKNIWEMKGINPNQTKTQKAPSNPRTKTIPTNKNPQKEKQTLESQI